MVASLASYEALWLRKLLVNLFGQELKPTMIYCDNQSYIQLSENPVFHDRSKHIEMRYLLSFHPRLCSERYSYFTVHFH